MTNPDEATNDSPATGSMQKAKRGTDWHKAAVALRNSKANESSERARLLRVRRLKEEGTVFSMDEIQAWLGPIMGGLRTSLLELPESLSEALNPADPIHAAAVLSEALERALNATVAQLAWTPHANKSRTRKPGRNGGMAESHSSPPAQSIGDGLGD